MIPSAKRQISPVVISTALGHDGRGIFPYTLLPGYRRLLAAVRETGATVFTKSATRFQRRGNFIPANPLTWKYIRRLPGLGLLNAYGLTNDGVDACAPDIRRSCDAGFRVIPNLYPEFIKGTTIAIRETLEAVEIYQRSLGPPLPGPGTQLLLPQLRGGHRQKRGPGAPVHPESAQPLSAAVFNRQAQHLPPLRVRPGTGAHRGQRPPRGQHHPLQHRLSVAALPPERGERRRRLRGPGLSPGLKYNQELRQKVDLFLIMGCGVTSADDVRRYFDLGADAVSLCTLALRKPREAARIVVQYNG